jgi:hypothetical protein
MAQVCLKSHKCARQGQQKLEIIIYIIRYLYISVTWALSVVYHLLVYRAVSINDG